jgi:tRNA U34 5-methylaminomethyl-2-thiouridine-forming methyltransferase MnmC
MWTVDVFRKMFEALSAGGILVTYCAKTSVQRALTEAGFTIEKLPGAKGKREMIRACKK